MYKMLCLFFSLVFLSGVYSCRTLSPEGGNASGDSALGADEYVAHQIAVAIDGDLSEWKDCPVIALENLKDAGVILPESGDFNGWAKIAWNEKDPTRLYFAYSVQDATEQFENSAGSWWFNDTAELIIEDQTGSLLQWAFNADGKTLHSGTTEENSQ